MNILLCTLGATWAVIPEIFGWLAPARLDLYAHHPDAARLDALRRKHGLQPPDELWICTTEGQRTLESLGRLRSWWTRIGTPMPLRVWTAAGTDQLATQAECDHVRELTLRVALAAAERVGATGQLVLSLAGGRKTMSADLQWAGTVFGAHAWLHVVGPEPLPAPLQAATPDTFAHALDAETAAGVTPLVAGSGRRSELLDIELDGHKVTSACFSLPLAAPDCSWPLPPEGPRLTREIRRREHESGQLLGNWLGRIASAEHHENWRSLYRLPPARIDTLRDTLLAATHRDWLVSLPKADLHRHLGGCLDLDAQIRVARAIVASLDDTERRSALAAVAPLLRQRDDWPWEWPASLRGTTPRQRAARAALLLTETSHDRLERNLYGVTEPRVALKRHPRGFAAYERPGELTGSAVLGHPAALTPYAEALVAQSRAEGLLYTELRGSPPKYRPEDPGGFVRDLRHALRAAGANPDDVQAGPHFGFIWILDRRHPDEIPAAIAAAVAAHRAHAGFLLGLDLAGDEATQRPDELAPHFLPAFAECLPITIHAGEGEAAENIWQASYHLHADRIGHGLSLAEHAALATRFRDRGICLELCPSSNREVVGFFDPALTTTTGLPPYPLRTLIDLGLPLTLCTDNPGISRTTLADEYLAAARMAGGLSQWEALALIKQGLVHAFLPARMREELLKTADRRIFKSMIHSSH